MYEMLVGYPPFYSDEPMSTCTKSNGEEMKASLLTLKPAPYASAKKKVVRHERIRSCYSKEDLKGQTVAVVGLGKSGRSAARLALTRGASVIAIDENENLVPLEQDPIFSKCGDLRTILGHCDREVLEHADRVVVSPGVPIENYGLSSLLNSGTAGALKCMKEMKETAKTLYYKMKGMKEREEELNCKLEFLGGLVVAFRDGIHSDIQVKPGYGLPIHAHRAVLSTRSGIFKNMLEADECKTAPIDTISLLELDHDELESLLEFLYSGNLDTKKIEKHVYSLYIAAHKYDIPYLQKFCEHRMLESLASSNALEVLEISDVCDNKIFKEAVMNFVVKNMNDIAFSTRFDEFTRKNPHLSVEITRALFKENNGKRKANLL